MSNQVKQAMSECHTLLLEGLTCVGDTSQQRQKLMAIARRCNQCKLLVLNWIESYFLEHPMQKAELLPETLVSQQLKNTLEEMAKTVVDGQRSKHLSEAFYQQKAVNKLLFLAYQAKIPVLEWLGNYYSNANAHESVAAVVVYRCHNPDCDFETTNKMAYVGHGPNRCLRKSNQLKSTQN